MTILEAMVSSLFVTVAFFSGQRAQEMEYPLWLRATNTTVLCASLAVFINLIVLN